MICCSCFFAKGATVPDKKTFSGTGISSADRTTSMSKWTCNSCALCKIYAAVLCFMISAIACCEFSSPWCTACSASASTSNVKSPSKPKFSPAIGFSTVRTKKQPTSSFPIPAADPLLSRNLLKIAHTSAAPQTDNRYAFTFVNYDIPFKKHTTLISWIKHTAPVIPRTNPIAPAKSLKRFDMDLDEKTVHIAVVTCSNR